MNIVPPSRDRYIVQYTLMTFLPSPLDVQTSFSFCLLGSFNRFFFVCSETLELLKS